MVCVSIVNCLGCRQPYRDPEAHFARCAVGWALVHVPAAFADYSFSDRHTHAGTCVFLFGDTVHLIAASALGVLFRGQLLND